MKTHKRPQRKFVKIGKTVKQQDTAENIEIFMIKASSLPEITKTHEKFQTSQKYAQSTPKILNPSRASKTIPAKHVENLAKQARLIGCLGFNLMSLGAWQTKIFNRLEVYGKSPRSVESTSVHSHPASIPNMMFFPAISSFFLMEIAGRWLWAES